MNKMKVYSESPTCNPVEVVRAAEQLERYGKNLTVLEESISNLEKRISSICYNEYGCCDKVEACPTLQGSTLALELEASNARLATYTYRLDRLIGTIDLPF